MGIAIKSLTDQDREQFDLFLTTKAREALPRLALAPLADPHESIAVVSLNPHARNTLNKEVLSRLAGKHGMLMTKLAKNTFAISANPPQKDRSGTTYLFSGYAFHEGKMFIGQAEVCNSLSDIDSLKGDYGEYCLCESRGKTIKLSSDFFGMVPWFYFYENGIFAASNHYHLLLLILKTLDVALKMNIKRSRVNMITSGFTYGSPFSMDLDVQGCKMTAAYEQLEFSPRSGVRTKRTELWDIISKPEPWNEDAYELYLDKAAEELEVACRASFEHPRFDKIVVDVSGGFDSRVVFATANNLPKKLRKKMHTFTRKSGTSDDVEVASSIINLFDYPKHTYVKTDTSELFNKDGELMLNQVSRTLGLFSPYSHLYTAKYNDYRTLEITGYLGEVIMGYMRCRGEVDYSLGDRRLLARLGGCYLHNSVTDLKEVFVDQASIINDTLKNYSQCDCLFKKFQMLYVDSRNRFVCGSCHNIENDNLRIPMLNSKYALKAKWMYFNLFTDNEVPDERISIDLLSKINPLLAAYPFAKENDSVIPCAEHQLCPTNASVNPDETFRPGPDLQNAEDLYKDKVIKYIDNLETAEQMLLQIMDYSDEYYPSCLGLYKVISIMKKEPAELKTTHGRETIRKIYDTYFQIQAIS